MCRDLYYRKTTTDKSRRIQKEFDVVINALKNYAARDNKYAEAKNKLLNNAKNFYEGREKIIEGFKNEIFSLYYHELYEYQMKEEEEEKKQDKKPFTPNEVIEWMINKEDAHVNNEVFEKYFKLQKSGLMYKVVLRTNDKKKNNELVNIFNSALKDLKEEIKNMPKEEIENENPDEIVGVVEMILDFNKQQQQSGKGLKILTPTKCLVDCQLL